VKRYSTVGFERLEFTVGGVRTVAYLAGSGPQVVYLHGGGTFNGFEFARTWLSRFRVLLPYLPGFGESADAPSLQTLHDYGRHVRALFDAHGIRQAHLVGASLGGRLAAQVAIANPETISSLVLVAPAGIVIPEYPQPDFPSLTYEDWPNYLVCDPAVIRPYWPQNPDEAFVAERAREARAAALLLADAAGTAMQFVRSLSAIEMQTMLDWGKEDRMMPAGNAQAWLAAIPKARLELLEHAGHLLLDESAAACALVADFMMESEMQRAHPSS